MKFALTCLAGLMALGLVGLAPDTASARYHGWRWGGGPGSASMSARATAMPIAIVPFTTTATPMGTVLAGGTITAIGTSGSLT
jgi:hypothetical protein